MSKNNQDQQNLKELYQSDPQTKLNRVLTNINCLFDRSAPNNKSRFLGYAFGYIFAKNTGLNNEYVYQYIWNFCYLTFSKDLHIKNFFYSFDKGRQLDETQIGLVFKKHQKNFDKYGNKLTLFKQLIMVIFLDSVISQRELNNYYRLGNLFQIKKETLDQILYLSLATYRFDYKAETNTFDTSFDFKNFKPEHVRNDPLGEAYLLFGLSNMKDRARIENKFNELMKHYTPNDPKFELYPNQIYGYYNGICVEIKRAWDLIQRS